MALQDYFPTVLAQLVQTAASIKTKTLKYLGKTFILTSLGQILISKDDMFELLPMVPITDIYVGIRRIAFITLDAKLIGEHEFDVENVIHVTNYGSLIVIDVTGDCYQQNDTDSSNFTLIKLSEPVVAEAEDFNGDSHFFLQQNGKVCMYHKNGQVEDIKDIEGITDITLNICVRLDGLVYERILWDQDPEVKEGDFKLDTSVKDIVKAVGEVNDILGQNEYALVTRNGDLLYKTVGDDIDEYEKINVGGAFISVSPAPLTVVRADGRVLTIINDVMTAIPRLRC